MCHCHRVQSSFKKQLQLLQIFRHISLSALNRSSDYRAWTFIKWNTVKVLTSACEILPDKERSILWDGPWAEQGDNVPGMLLPLSPGRSSFCLAEDARLVLRALRWSGQEVGCAPSLSPLPSLPDTDRSSSYSNLSEINASQLPALTLCINSMPLSPDNGSTLGPS